jgi:hypothetical protein
MLARVTLASDDHGISGPVKRPPDIDASSFRPGMSGTATVYAADSRPLDLIGWLLLYGRALALYL